MEFALVGALMGAWLTGQGAFAKPALPAGYLRVPAVTQETDYSCGAAALLSTLKYWKAHKGMEAELYPLLKTTPKYGTHPDNIVAGARALGLAAVAAENQTPEQLAEALNRGETPILDIQAWRDDTELEWEETWSEGHYVVAIGMDESYVYAMDPVLEDHYGYIPIDELEERWHDFEGESVEQGRVYEGLAIYVRADVPKGEASYKLDLERIE